MKLCIAGHETFCICKLLLMDLTILFMTRAYGSLMARVDFIVFSFDDAYVAVMEIEKMFPESSKRCR
jgi:hypothetical protein